MEERASARLKEMCRMARMFRSLMTHPMLALGGTLLYGVIELMALQRVYRYGRDASIGARGTTTRRCPPGG